MLPKSMGHKTKMHLQGVPPKHSTNIITIPFLIVYSHLSNKRGGLNKRDGGGVCAKLAKSLNVEAGINVESGIFWKILVHIPNVFNAH